jgi:hypothetical protein
LNPNFESKSGLPIQPLFAKNYSAVVDLALENSAYFGNLQLAIRLQSSDFKLISKAKS